jgi:DNA-binding LytR/AlgR family response regulator
MNSLKNMFFIALIFGFYQMLIGLFFGSYIFLDSSIDMWSYLGGVLTLITLMQLITLIIISKKVDSARNRSIFVGISFLFSSFVGGTLTFVVFSSNYRSYFIYIASFLISAFLPSVLFLLNFMFKDAAVRLTNLQKKSTIQNPKPVTDNTEKVFHLENENGKLLLEVPIDRIICYEANDNYVITYYLDKQQSLKRSMERVSLKKVEELLAIESVDFFRVHKSYLINPDYLEEIKGKAQAYKIKLREFESLIPVSRSYDITILEKRKF